MTIIDFLKKCDDCYYNSFNYYKPTSDEIKFIFDELNISITDEVNDTVYDEIYYKAKSKYPFDSYFGTVGASIENNYGKDIKFETPMGSMTELKKGDWDKWRIDDYYIVSEKLDGLSVILFYEKGKLIKSASRGDGIIGKDITHHILNVTNIPKCLTCPVDIEVRGELICPREDIQNMINDLKSETGREYKNGRNTISGFLNSKETLKSVAKYAKFNAFDCSGDYKCEIDRFSNLQLLGFDVVKYYKIPNSMLNEDDLIEITTNVKTNSKYECDGIILTINNVTDNYKGYETGTINPKKSRKFKISNIKNDAETTITNINWQVSKSGRFTPVIQIEPVNLCGVTITNVTGHNYKNIIDNGIGIGSKICVLRSGDVIPFIKSVITTSDNYNLPNVETIVDGVDLVIKNKDIINEYTNEMKIQQMLYFTNMLDVDCLGYGNLKEIYNKGYNTEQLLSMNKDTFVNILGVNGAKAYDSLQRDFTEVEYMSAFNAFGDGISKNILQSVFDKYYTLDVTIAQLKMVNGFGDNRITQYISHLDKYHNIINYLKSINRNIKIVENKIISSKLSNYIVCFTGVRDAKLSQYIIENGGIASDSWNKNVNLLIAKDPNGNSGKISKAIERNIKVVSLDEAKQLLEYEDL